MNTAQLRTVYPYWFTTKLIPAKILGFLTYVAFAIFNVWNFFFYSPARFTNNDIYYWVYAITGLVISSLILTLVVYVKKERRFISSRIRTTKVEDVIIQDITAQDYAGVQVTTTTKKIDLMKDDLKNVEGIGSKIEELLNSAGINTFRELAVANTLDLRNILEQAGPRFKMHNPESWSFQAGLARDGKWSELKELQDRLVAGQ